MVLKEIPLQGKKLIIYGAGGVGSACIVKCLQEGYNIAYAIDRNPNINQIDVPGYSPIMVKRPQELQHERKGEIIIIVSLNFVYIKEVFEFLNKMGFEEDKDYYLLTESAPYDYFDPFLGNTRMYNELCGFDVYGKSDSKFKIVALGSSTTDPTRGDIKSWPEQLWEIIDRDDVCVFNGGIGGYTTGRELLKLIRDVLPLQPNLVISFSGICEANHYHYNGDFPMVCWAVQNEMKEVVESRDKKVTFGNANPTPPEELFVRNERLMRGIISMCEKYMTASRHIFHLILP